MIALTSGSLAQWPLQGFDFHPGGCSANAGAAARVPFHRTADGRAESSCRNSGEIMAPKVSRGMSRFSKQYMLPAYLKEEKNEFCNTGK